MKTETIEVELPEGWKAVAHRKPLKEEYILYGDEICKPKGLMNRPWLIVEKIQPRRTVLEETGEERAYPINGYMYGYIDGAGFVKYKILREVKETDIPLTNSESKLSLSVDECRNVRSLIKDFENLGWFVNPASSLLLQKITEFIKDK